MEIASGAGAGALQADCADVALNPSEPLGVRVSAANLVAVLGDAETRQRLLPLVLGALPDDIEDDLKGTALRAVWPVHLTAARLFSVLTPEKRPSRSGAYGNFLSNLPDQLEPNAVAKGLRWACEVRGYGMHRQLADAIVLQAWEHLDQQEVLAALCDLIVVRYGRHEDLLEHDWDEFASKAQASPEGRKRLITALVPRMGTHADRITLGFGDPRQQFLGSDDVRWLLERTIACEDDDEDGPVWARLLRIVVDLREPGAFATLYRQRDNAHIKSTFGYWWDPIVLDSPAAEEHRRHQWRMEEFEEQRELRRQAGPPPPSAERILDILGLGSSESGGRDLDSVAGAWCHAAQELVRSEDGRFLLPKLSDS